jgi:hypothetical protein
MAISPGGGRSTHFDPDVQQQFQRRRYNVSSA